MRRFLSWLFVASVIASGAARFLPLFPPFRGLWIAGLIAGELGLLFVVPLLILGATAALGKSKDHALGIASGIALFLVCLPLFELAAQERNWIWDLHYSHLKNPAPEIGFPNPYGIELASPLFKFQDLFQIPEKMQPKFETFNTRDGSNLEILIYTPKGESALITPKKPWILSIHGGGWDSGKPADLDLIYGPLLKSGTIVIAPDYRFAPTYPWPKQQDDVESAYEWVVKNADRLSIDPEKFWIMGRSAGGQIALKLAYNYKFSTEASPALKPRGVINLYAPTDLDFAYRWSPIRDVLNSRNLLQALIGTTPDLNPSGYAVASPLNDVKLDSPPTLSIYGKSDPLVWYRHGQRLHSRLISEGVRSTLIELPWGTHGFDFLPNTPGGQITTNSILRFMKETN